MKADVKCEVCGNTFSCPPSHVNRRKTCSRGCQAKLKRMKGLLIKKCPVCGKSIAGEKSLVEKRTTCSKACAGVLRRKRVTKRCLICGHTFEVYWYRRVKAHFCSRRCRDYSLRIVKRRPTKDQLESLLKRATLDQVAKLYDVTENAIRFWCEQVGAARPTKLERAALKREKKKYHREVRHPCTPYD